MYLTAVTLLDFLTDNALIYNGFLDRWQPHQPHPGTQCHRYGCSLPGLTGFTADRCGGTDGVTITMPASWRAAPLYRSDAKLQPLMSIKNLKKLKHLCARAAARCACCDTDCPDALALAL